MVSSNSRRASCHGCCMDVLTQGRREDDLKTAIAEQLVELQLLSFSLG